MVVSVLSVSTLQCVAPTTHPEATGQHTYLAGLNSLFMDSVTTECRKYASVLYESINSGVVLVS